MSRLCLSAPFQRLSQNPRTRNLLALLLDSWTAPKASHGKGIQQVLFRKQSVTPSVSPSAFVGSSVSWQGTGSQLRAGTGSPLETVSPSQHHPMKLKVKTQTSLKNRMFFPATRWESRGLCGVLEPQMPSLLSSPFPLGPVHWPVGMLLNLAPSPVSTQIYYL